MGEVDTLWAGWRSEYVTGGKTDETAKDKCIFCSLLNADLPAQQTNIVWRNDVVAALLNAFPYTPGHLLIMPIRHTANLSDLSSHESLQLWQSINDATQAVQQAYSPDGLNIGFNLGRSSGAGIPDHLHAHVLPRWSADTNFMLSVANTRVLPEALGVSWERLNSVWPSDNFDGK